MKNIHKIKPERSKSGQGLSYKNPKTKLQLAKDFHHCCGYCGDAHHYTGGIKSYHIDHFAPKSKFKELTDYYGNFVYCCPYCNLSKKDKWIGKTPSENIVDGIGFVDPCSLNYSDHLYRTEDGSITYSTTIGQYMYYELKLYLERHRILYQLEELKDKINKIKQKIEINRDLGLDTRELTEMLSILYEAHFYYFSSFCEELDSAIQ